MFFGGDPFGGGGFPGGHPGMGGRSKGPVDNKEYYELLGVERDVDAAKLKKVYRKLAVKHHPDKGGDPDLFKRINQAYDVISDPKKRKLYDQGGKEAVEQGGDGGGRNADDIFSQFFGGGGRSRQDSEDDGPKKGKAVVQEIGVSLEDLYNGKVKRFKISQTRIKCPEGMSKEDAVQKCATCDGQGVVLQIRRMGPMIQQMQTPCPDCRGQGVEIKPGVRQVQQKKMLEVHVEKGMKNGAQIKLDGEGDEKPGMLPGDIVFVVREKEHEVFKRKGADLLIQKKITLSEALCGVKFTLNHLDGRELLIESAPGSVVEHQSVMAVESEGMPFHGNPFTKGRLFVLFEVVMPAAGSLSPQQLQVIKASLPGPDEECEPSEEAEPCTLEAINVESFGKAGPGGGAQAYDSDDEGGMGGGQRVQCAQQ